MIIYIIESPVFEDDFLSVVCVLRVQWSRLPLWYQPPIKLQSYQELSSITTLFLGSPVFEKVFFLVSD